MAPVAMMTVCALHRDVARGDRERPPAEVDASVTSSSIISVPKRCGLLPERLHERRAVDAVGEARVVLDQRREHELAAGLEPAEHDRREVGARRVDRRRVARPARSR